MLVYVKIIGLLPRKSHKEKECKKLEKDQYHPGSESQQYHWEKDVIQINISQM